LKKKEKVVRCFECGQTDGAHEDDCTLKKLGVESSRDADGFPGLALNRAGLPRGKPTDEQRRLKGSIDLKDADRKEIAKDADNIVKMFEEGNVDALLLESVQFTAMNISYLKWLRNHPPQGRSNTQALLNGLNEARAQLIELLAIVKERQRANKTSGPGDRAHPRKKRRVSATKRA